MTNTDILVSPQFHEALGFASELHRDQARKETGIPYVSHLLSVCALAPESVVGHVASCADSIEELVLVTDLRSVTAILGQRSQSAQ